MKSVKRQKRCKKSVNFTVREKCVAKFGLCVTPFVMLFGGLSFVHQTFAPLFVCSAALLLVIAGVLFVTAATRDAQRAVKKILETSRNCSRRLSAALAQPDNVMLKNFSIRRHTCRARTYVRSYHSASRPAFAHASGGDSSGGGSDSGSGDPDPPRLICSFPVTLFQNFYQKSNSFFLSVARFYAALTIGAYLAVRACVRR